MAVDARQGCKSAELRPFTSAISDTYSPIFQEFRHAAEKSISLVWQLIPEEKVEAFLLWNCLAKKLQQIIEKATDEIVYDIVELTSTNNPAVLSGTDGQINTETLTVPASSSQSEQNTATEQVHKLPSSSGSSPKTTLELKEKRTKSIVTGSPNEITVNTSEAATKKPADLPTGKSKPGNSPTQCTVGSANAFTCQTCFKSFEEENLLTEHTASLHPSNSNPASQKRFKCKECACSFSTRGNLTVHIRKHSGERPFECPKCPVRFTSGGNLRRHLLSHQGLKPYQCSLCESRFTEKKSLLIHQRSHSGEKPYICPQCNKGFAQSSILQSHLTVHSNEKPFLCHQCGKSFKEKQQLRAHEKRHRGAKTQICDYCDASFVTKGDLTRHRKSHMDPSFKCTKCKKSFMRRQTLTAHVCKNACV